MAELLDHSTMIRRSGPSQLAALKHDSGSSGFATAGDQYVAPLHLSLWGVDVEQKAPILGSSAFHQPSVLAIAIPMTLAYLTTPLLGLVDTAIIGRFGDASLLGGLAAGAMVFNVVFTIFNFLRSGTTGLFAQAFGRHDATEERAVFWRAFVFAAMSGLALVALTPLIVTIGKWFIGAEPGVTAVMENYIRIRLVSAPAALINYAMLGYSLGRGEAGRGLFLQLVLNGLNIGLSDF